MAPSDPLFPISQDQRLLDDPSSAIQAIEVPGTASSDATGHYRLVGFPELLTIDSNPEFPRTLYEAFNRSLRLRPERPLFGYRAVNRVTGELENSFTWMDHREVDRHRKLVGSGLLALEKQGIVNTGGKKSGWTVANWMANRPEWQFVHFSVASYDLRLTSLYDTLGPNVVEYCVNHAEVKVVFTSAGHLPDLIKLADKCPEMKVIVSVDNFAAIDLKHGGKPIGGLLKKDALKAWGASKGVTVMDLDELELLGSQNLAEFVPPAPDNVLSIMYTSGTTGMPKGVLITHRNLISASIAQLVGNATTEAGDVSLSYLPLSHIFEQFVEVVLLLNGVGIGFACGDMTRLIEDIQLLRPHTLVSVPRVLNRFYQVVKGATLDGPGLKGALSRRAFESAFAQLDSAEPSLPGPLNIYDKLVFKKVRAAFGGRLKFISTGSAPIAPEVLKFFTVALGRHCMLVEGYGQTEGMGTAVRCTGGDRTAFGYVGPPLPCCEIKLLDVPDMGYLHTDLPYPRGEILVRGENIFKGYYKDEKNTAETLDADGWLHSGDIGLFDPKGRLKIIDRKKNLLKLSQGEYVALEKVENTYALSPIVAQMYVHGDSLKDHLVAIVVPEPIAFTAFLKKIGKAPASEDPATLASMMKEKDVIDATLKELSTYHQGKLVGFEQIKRLHLEAQPFHESLLTPTLKIKRNIAKEYYKDIIAKLYGEPSAPTKGDMAWNESAKRQTKL